MLNAHEVKDVINGAIFASRFSNIENPILEYRGSDIQLVGKNYEIKINYDNVYVFIFINKIEDAGNKTEIHICTSHNSYISDGYDEYTFDEYKATYNPFIKKWYIYHYEDDIQVADRVIENKRIGRIIDALLEINKDTAVREKYKGDIGSLTRF